MKYWLPVVLWMAFIFWMSTGDFSSDNTASIILPVLRTLFPGLSSGQLDAIHAVLRKCGHIVEYFILGLLLFRAFRAGSAGSGMLRWAISALIVTAVYAASDEFHQSFIAARTASFSDAGIDIAGGIVAQGIAVLSSVRRRKSI